MLKSTFSGLTQSLTMWVYVCDAQGLSVYSNNLIQHGDPKNKTLFKQNTQKRNSDYTASKQNYKS